MRAGRAGGGVRDQAMLAWFENWQLGRDGRFPTNPRLLEAARKARPGDRASITRILTELLSSELLIETPDTDGSEPSGTFEILVVNQKWLGAVFTDDRALHAAFPDTSHVHERTPASELFERLLECGLDGAILNPGRPEAIRIFLDELAWLAAGLIPDFRPPLVTDRQIAAAAAALVWHVAVTGAWFLSPRLRDASQASACAFTCAASLPWSHRHAIADSVEAALRPIVPGAIAVPVPLAPDPSPFVRPVFSRPLSPPPGP
jgi:hypothetical protein